MFPRRPTASSSGNGSTRRAFRDVTNSHNVDHKSVEKRSDQAALAIVRSSVRSENPAAAPTVVHRQGEDVNPAVAAPRDRAVLPRQSLLVSLGSPNHRRTRSLVASNPLSYQHTGVANDIDERDAEDPICVVDYVQDLYDHFRQREVRTSVRPIYMEGQSHINERMRSILVDWLVQVHLQFKLVPETLYLTVNLIDRYLERREILRSKLQLVGITSLLIACKYEEIYLPEVRDLAYICDRAYSKHEILEMEEEILKTLEYQITVPSPHAFLVRYLKAAHANKEIVQLSCYILDGTLQSYRLLQYMPSQLAAAAVFIARRCVGRNSWSPTLLRYAGYYEEEIIPVARAVLTEKSSASDELQAVNKKYSKSRFGGVSKTVLHCDF